MMKNKHAKIFSVLLALVMIFSSMPIAGFAEASDFASQIPAKETAGATFRLGVVSDSHLDPEVASTKLTAKNMNKALETMQAVGVDALVMNGDMVYAPQGNVPENLYSALKGIIETNGTFTLAGAMNEDGITFEADTADGKKPIIYSMGNHEFPLNGTSAEAVTASKALFTAQTGRAPGHVMNIGGYTFIVGEPADYLLDYRTVEEFVMNQILEAEKDGSNRPIFYLQHEAVFGTVIESPSTASDNTEEFKNFLKQHPRVVVFSGHSHAIIEDPRCIWQDGFTAIATSQLGGGSVSGGSASYSMGLNYTGSQAIMIDLTEKTGATDVSVYRLNLLTNEVIGTPFEFTIDGTANDTFVYGDDRYNAGVSTASFKAGSTLTINNNARQGFKFTFKTTDVVLTEGEDAAYLQDNYVHGYRVVLENKNRNVKEQNFRIFGDVFEAKSSHASSYSVTFPDALNLGTNYKLSVYALTPLTTTVSADELEARGIIPVTYEFKTADDFTDEEKESIKVNGGINVAFKKTVYSGDPSRGSAIAGSKLVNGSYSDVVYPGNYTQDTVTLPSGAETAAATGNANDWFMVDLGKRYEISNVKVHPRSSSQTATYMQGFVIEASNDEAFTNAIPLGEVKNNDSSVDGTKAVTIPGNGKSYRYIRLRKTAATYHVYSEIEIFAKVRVADDLTGPKVIEATRVDDYTIGVAFTEKIDIESLEKDGAVEVLKNDNTSLEISSISLTDADEWDGGYDATLTFDEIIPSGGLTLKVNSILTTVEGINFTQTTVPVAGKALSINKSYSKERTGINVAKKKPVYAGNTNNQTNAAKLVDGSYSNIVGPETYTEAEVTLPSGARTQGATSNANDWFVIDLLRRYKVSSVVVHPRSTDQEDVYMQGFVIEGSNDESFADAVKLGEVKNNDPNVDGTTAVSFDVDGAGYRYIRLRKTVGTYHVYSEIEVFADVTITDVARGKSAEVGEYYNTGASSAVDGKTSTYWRVSGTNTFINNLVVDLGDEYPVEMAELYRQANLSNYYNEYTAFDAYGYAASAEKPATTGGPTASATKLFTSSTGFSSSVVSQYFDFNAGSYRYMVLSKAVNKACGLAEFKAFVVNPEAYSAVVNDDNTITISFTDKMEFATLKESNFEIDGVVLSNPTVESGWDGGYDVTFNYDGEIINGTTLTISDKVRNQNGIEMASEQVITFELDTFSVECNGEKVEKITAGASHDVTAKYISKQSGTVKLYVAVKSGNTLISCVMSEPVAVAAGEVAELEVLGVTPKVGEKLCIYLWEDGTLLPIAQSVTVTE